MAREKRYTRYLKILALAFLLPCLYGCQGGGSSGGSSGASLSSFAFGAGDDSGSLPLILDSSSNSGNSGSGTPSGNGTDLATLHHPEPATMFLLGSGIVAMRFARNRKNRLARD